MVKIWLIYGQYVGCHAISSLTIGWLIYINIYGLYLDYIWIIYGLYMDMDYTWGYTRLVKYRNLPRYRDSNRYMILYGKVGQKITNLGLVWFLYVQIRFTLHIFGFVTTSRWEFLFHPVVVMGLHVKVHIKVLPALFTT